ncbi:MAG TPA: hypothetical protein VFS02_23665, partial [Telluria sp.]|nr:hypothetical protein [Telluria sp.]
MQTVKGRRNQGFSTRSKMKMATVLRGSFPNKLWWITRTSQPIAAWRMMGSFETKIFLVQMVIVGDSDGDNWPFNRRLLPIFAATGQHSGG